MIGIEDQVAISLPNWPKRAETAPGDLTKYAPIGLGMASPMVVMPWDTLEGSMSRGSFYGANGRSGDPMRDAPINDSSGGVIYFDSGTESPQLAAVLTFLDVWLLSTSYAVFASESTDTKSDRYLAQLRIVDLSGLSLFGAIPDDGKPVEQKLSIGGLVDAFISAQQKIWGSGMSSELEGTLGGDGDWASEKLAFGFMVENGSNGVYRLWSRPWLVTK